MNKDTMKQTAPTKTGNVAIDSAVKQEEELKLVDTRPKTRGDRFYDVVQFMIGKVFILAATAALAFTADSKHGPEKVMGMPNYLKKMQIWAEKAVAPMREWGKVGGKVVNESKNDKGILLAAGLSSTLVLSWGGTLFSPFIKSLENGREGITNWYNKKFGTPEEVKITHEKYRDMPKQNWADVLKGRAMAYATVFSAVTGAFLFAGRSKNKNPDTHFKLQDFEEIVGRNLSRLTKESKPISRIPLDKPLPTDAMKANKTYRFGKVLAIDLFATTTAIIVWNTVSRLSAKKRVAHEQEEHKPAEASTTAPKEQPQAATEQHFSDKIAPNTNREDALNKKPADKSNFSDIVAEQRALNETEKASAITG